MASEIRSEIVVILNAEGLSRKENARAWREWAEALPVKCFSFGLEEIHRLREHIPVPEPDSNDKPYYTHAWVVDANYLPYISAFRATMRKHMSPDTTFTVFHVKEPMSARHFYEGKWTTMDDKHDKFGGIRYISLASSSEPYLPDESYQGSPVEFAHFACSRLAFPYCVFQLQSNEPDVIAKENYKTVKSVYTNAIEFASTLTILGSHIQLARRSDTEMFVVFDADFRLEKPLMNEDLKPWELDSVHLWYARNPINGLEYGHGGPKAFNRDAFTNLDGETLDVTTSASTTKLLIHPQVVGVHAFNWSALSTWRTAFREVAKLTLGLNTISDLDVFEEAYLRREIWTKEADSRIPFADVCQHGAREGKSWAEHVNSRVEAARINDFEWLDSEFNKRYGAKGN